MSAEVQVNHYETLGLSVQASPEDIRRAYRRLARKFHPDLNPGDGAEDQFKKITQAYEVLGDTEKKAQYDKTLWQEKVRNQRAEYQTYREQTERLRRAQEQKRTSFDEMQKANRVKRKQVNSSSQFWDVFGGVTEGIGTSLKRLFRFGDRSSSIAIAEVVVTIPESINGAKKTVELEGRKIQMQIPPGVRSGSVIKLRTKSRPSEDLVVIVRLAPHPYLSIHPRGLVAEIPVTLHEIASGARIRVPTLDSEVVLQIPKGTQSGREICLKGKGIVDKDGSRGDLFLKLVVQIPTSTEFEGLAEIANAMYTSSVRGRLGSRLVK